ncbi:MAG: class I SAM-dependent methyltransferase [Oscillospiraceae bacterium]|nr:class I SAM-dependent methyltransferase [Oscillospiraceae bacterium]
MYFDFLNALNQKYGVTDAAELSEAFQAYHNYAANSNAQAKIFINECEASGFPLNKKKILDVGCAYGGLVIESAKLGAIACGVELDYELYQFALLNAQNEDFGEGLASFMCFDATSHEFIDKLPHNYFDIIVLTDVFEHIYDTVALLKNLSILGNDNCVIYFAIPNADDFHTIRRDAHCFLPGMCLIDPMYWSEIINSVCNSGISLLTYWPIDNVYYRPYEYYDTLFRHFGFSNCRLPYYPHDADEETVEHIRNEYNQTIEMLKHNEQDFPEIYTKSLRPALTKHRTWFNHDIEKLLPSALQWKYSTSVWRGFAAKSPLCHHHQTETGKCVQINDMPPSEGGCHGRFDTAFTLKLDSSLLSIDVRCAPHSEDLEFAFYLYRNHKCIDMVWYQDTPAHKWKLDHPGIYNSEIFVRPKSSSDEAHDIIETSGIYFEG